MQRGSATTRAWNALMLAVTVLIFADITILFFSKSDILKDYLNSDNFYMSTLFSDVFSRGGKFSDWYLTPSPYFFPDYLFAAAAYVSGATPPIQLALFSLVQCAVTLVLIAVLARVVGGIRAPAAVLAFSAIVWFAVRAEDPFNLLFYAGFHYGVFIATILLAILWFLYENRPSAAKMAAICALSFATTISDNIFLIQASVPLAFTILLQALIERSLSWRKVGEAAAPVVASLLGSASYFLVVAHPTRYPIEFGFHNITATIVWIGGLLRDLPATTPTYAIVMAGYAVVAVVLARRFFSGATQDAGERRLALLVIFATASALSMLAAEALVISIPHAPRYQLQTFSWPIIILSLFMAMRWQGRFIPVAGVVSAVIAAALTWNAGTLVRQNGFNPKIYPEEMACIDDALEPTQARHGVSQYWDAKRTQALSRLDLTLAAYLDIVPEGDNLLPFKWITTDRYFRDRYDFVLVDLDAPKQLRIESDLMKRMSGPPQKSVQCGRKLLHVYTPGAVRIKRMETASEPATWRGCDLQTQAGRYEKCEIRKTAGVGGIVMAGPYELLASGRYGYELDYSSSAQASDPIGEWELWLTYDRRRAKLETKTLKGSDGAPSIMKGEFSVAPEQASWSLEIKLRSQEKADMTISSFKLRKID